MKCKSSVQMYVSHERTIRKHKFTFYYTFTSKADGEVALRIFEIGTCEPFLEHHGNRRENRTAVYVAPGGYNRNAFNPRAQRYHNKPLFAIPELEKLRKLSDVEIPQDVQEEVRKKVGGLILVP